MLGQLCFQGRDQLTVLVVDRTLPAKLVIVFCHLQHALSRDILAAKDIFQKRHDIRGLLGPPKEVTRIAS